MVLEFGLGFMVGVIMALTGAGGGILAVPLLVFGMHMSVAQAGPISLFAVGSGAILGTVLGLKEGVVRYRAALLMAVAGVVLAPFGVWLARHMHSHWLGVVFAGVLLFVSYRSFRPVHGMHHDSNVLYPCMRSEIDGRFMWTTRCVQVLALSGAAAGVISGLLGVGGGFLMVPSLRRYTDLSPRSTIATALAATALISVGGILSNLSVGTVNWRVALVFSVGTLVGMLGGSWFSVRLRPAYLQKLFAVVIAVVAMLMLAQAFGAYARAIT